MNPQDVSELNPKARIDNTLPVLQPGEHVLFTVKRHPIGILRVYALCLLVTLLVGVLALTAAPDDSGEQTAAIGTLAMVITGAIATGFALIISKIYWGNTWTLTTDSLTQVDQLGIFRRHSSQLSLENIEDVSSEQNGLLPRMFNYGRLLVQTAGEHNKFTFRFTPNPNYYATQILAAREAFEKQTHREAAIAMAKHASGQQVPAQAPAQPQPVPPPANQAQQTGEPEIVSYEVPGGPDGSI